MKKIYQVSEDEAKIAREKMKTVKNKTAYRKLEAIALLGEGNTPQEVAHITKYNEQYVKNLGCQFHQKDLDDFAKDGRKGGNNRIMSKQDAKKFLEQFEEKALNGQIITISEIAKALNLATNKEHKSLSTAYYFIHCNKWRKIIPRSQHPKKASDEVIETSKKYTQNTEKSRKKSRILQKK